MLIIEREAFRPKSMIIIFACRTIEVLVNNVRAKTFINKKSGHISQDIRAVADLVSLATMHADERRTVKIIAGGSAEHVQNFLGG